MTESSTSDWRQAIDEVGSIREELSLKFNDDELVERLAAFVDYPRWEVRKIVAEALLYVHPDRQFRFLPLLEDDSQFVSAAAASSMKRAGMFAEETAKRKRMNLELYQRIDRIRAGGKTSAKVLDELDHAYGRQMSNILTAVSHDIRNVLMPLVSNGERASRMLEQPLTSADQRELARIMCGILERSRIMERIADDLRTWSKPTPAARELELVEDMVRQAHSFAVEFFASTGQPSAGFVTPVFDIPSGMQCRVARESMLRVFTNLIKNAYEAHMKSGRFAIIGTVTVSARHVPAGIEIDFTDTGRGMSEDDLAVVRQFRPCGFSKKKNGTGMGMAIACAKVRDHGGNITIRSEIDKGTTVTVFLPEKGA